MILEGDTIRASGTNTMVDLWLVDRVRPICVTREAIAANVGFAKAESMTDDDRCRFVRDNLALVVTAAKSVLHANGPGCARIELDGQSLAKGAGAGAAAGEDRRKGNRRVTNRRRVNGQPETLAGGEKRKNSRRQGERRRPAASPTPA